MGNFNDSDLDSHTISDKPSPLAVTTDATLDIFRFRMASIVLKVWLVLLAEPRSLTEVRAATVPAAAPREPGEL